MTKWKRLTPEELEKGPELTDREQALLDGTAENVKKSEVKKFIDKLKRYNWCSRAYAVRVRYRRFFPHDVHYNDKGFSICELEGLEQDFQYRSLREFLNSFGYPLQTLTPCPREAMEFRATFSERLQAGMAASQLNEQKLSQMSCIPLEEISEYLDGTKIPTLEKGKQLATIMQVDEGWLMDKESTGFSPEDLVEVYNQLNAQDRLRVYGLASALNKKNDDMWK